MGLSPDGSRRSWVPSLRMPSGQKGLSYGCWGPSPCLHTQRSWRRLAVTQMATKSLPSWVTSGMIHATTGCTRWSGNKAVKDGCWVAPYPGQHMGDWWGSIIPSRASTLNFYLRTGLTSPWKPRPAMRRVPPLATLNLPPHPPAHRPCLRAALQLWL